MCESSLLHAIIKSTEQSHFYPCMFYPLHEGQACRRGQKGTREDETQKKNNPIPSPSDIDALFLFQSNRNPSGSEYKNSLRKDP